MPRRKKQFMLLRGKFGTFIVGERKWYDSAGIAKTRKWKIVQQSDDYGALMAMAGLTDKHVKMEVNITSEETNESR